MNIFPNQSYLKVICDNYRNFRRERKLGHLRLVRDLEESEYFKFHWRSCFKSNFHHLKCYTVDKNVIVSITRVLWYGWLSYSVTCFSNNSFLELITIIDVT